MWESFSLSPNSRMASAAGRRMLKPSLILRRRSPRMKEVVSMVQAESWAPLEMAVSNASRDHGGPVWAGMPSYTYLFRRAAAGCVAPSGRPPSVFLCLLARNDKMEGASRISLAVALAVAARSSLGESTGGG